MKNEQLIKVLNDMNGDAMWISNPKNIFYLTDYHSDPHERLFALLIEKDGTRTLFAPQMEVEDIKNSPYEGNILGYLDTEDPYEKFGKTLNHMLVEAEYLTVKREHELKDAFQVAQFSYVDDEVKALRNIKTDDELSKLRRAAEIADTCIEIGKDFLKVGVTEREVVNHIETQVRQYGVSEMSFDTMVLFGDHAASPHGVPGDRQLADDEYVLFDLGVVYQNYCSDITRTIPFGTPSEDAQRIYQIVLEAETEAMKMVKPGVKISDVDRKARGIIEAQGFGEYFPHRLGHGLGIDTHEYPDISNKNDNVFKEGMVFTIEPGIYKPGVAGVRIEDDILVTKDGYESLTRYAK
ncbi:M24 family metallopeptidase [Staphylococcus massiliensis]|uniref:M24 family metallopeptidase n=1 Tax=Staphylococcus massiliensis TaxID=555791 RepID=UPI001EE060DB|nr:Xaa-Pro peptidase family protein [Staphylococcus massiliensis]MCG3399138.1 Xaa-Pro peptidase family protein [Staphylococcus massiliensis]